MRLTVSWLYDPIILSTSLLFVMVWCSIPVLKAYARSFLPPKKSFGTMVSAVFTLWSSSSIRLCFVLITHLFIICLLYINSTTVFLWRHHIFFLKTSAEIKRIRKSALCRYFRHLQIAAWKQFARTFQPYIGYILYRCCSCYLSESLQKKRLFYACLL